MILETLRPDLLREGDAGRLQAFLLYVASAAPQLGREQLAGILESTFPKQGQALMATIAEQWVNEGREEGLEKGRLEMAVKKGTTVAAKNGARWFGWG